MASGSKNKSIADTFKGLPWIWIVVCLVGFIIGLFIVNQYGRSIFPPSVEIDNSKREVTLYFVAKDGKRLKAEESTVKRGTLEAEILGVAQGLIKGSRGPLDPVIPVGTRILGVKVDGNIALIDFSVHIKKNHWGGTTAELLTVFSVVNSIALNFNSIEKVQILIEGERFDTLAGHIRLDKPLAAKSDIIEG